MWKDLGSIRTLNHSTHWWRSCTTVRPGRLQSCGRMAAKPRTPSKVNLVTLRENGPLAFRAELHIGDHPVHYRATLCRCGQSRNKPFCDGAHTTIGFVATGEPPAVESQPLAARAGPVRVKPLPFGPLEVSGNLEIVSGGGRTIDRSTKVNLCRCGASLSKPYCDGSHVLAGFDAP